MNMNIEKDIPSYKKIIVREDEASALISISSKTLSEWRKNGEGPPCFSKGKFWFYPIECLKHWAISKVNAQQGI